MVGPPMETTRAPEEIGLAWFLRIRWALGLGAVALILAALYGTDADLPATPLLGLATFALGSNAFLVIFRSRAGKVRGLLGGLLLLDIIALTIGFLLSGGPANPFTVLFLVYVALAATVLGARWAWALVAVTVACFGALFVLTPAADAGGDPHAHHMHMDHGGGMGGMGEMDADAGPGGFSLHLYGMFIAFAMTAGTVSYLGTRVTRTLRTRDRELAEAHDRAARSERLASLTTLAAGAAHEMGTPLGTIAVVAGELERRAQQLGTASLVDDAQLIQAEVRRCREILDHLNERSGGGRGAAPEEVPVTELLASLEARLPDNRKSRFTVTVDDDLPKLSVPRHAFIQALGNLVDNAFDASPDEASVSLEARGVDQGVSFIVHDDGRGMDAAELEKAIEPFYSTKAEGHGMGLGLFLARAVAEQMGGTLSLTSSPDAGTTATAWVPA